MPGRWLVDPGTPSGTTGGSFVFADDSDDDVAVSYGSNRGYALANICATTATISKACETLGTESWMSGGAVGTGSAVLPAWDGKNTPRNYEEDFLDEALHTRSKRRRVSNDNEFSGTFTGIDFDASTAYVTSYTTRNDESSFEPALESHLNGVQDLEPDLMQKTAPSTYVSLSQALAQSPTQSRPGSSMLPLTTPIPIRVSSTSPSPPPSFSDAVFGDYVDLEGVPTDPRGAIISPAKAQSPSLYPSPSCSASEPPLAIHQQSSSRRRRRTSSSSSASTVRSFDSISTCSALATMASIRPPSFHAPFTHPLTGLNLTMGYNTSLPKTRLDMYITAARQMALAAGEGGMLRSVICSLK
jgi:hypothetical protein